MARSQGQRTILDENRCSWSPWMRGLGALGGLMAGMTMATTAAWGHGAHIQARPAKPLKFKLPTILGIPSRRPRCRSMALTIPKPLDLQG
jgi:hypothetical protein